MIDPAYRILRVGPDDLAVFVQVADEVFDGEIDLVQLRAFVQSSERVLVIAVHDGVVVAQCTAFVHVRPDKPADLYIDELGTTPGHQRRGLGRALLREAFAWGAERGCTAAWVTTDVDNHPARALYQTLAVAQTDAVVYEVSLTPRRSQS